VPPGLRTDCCPDFLNPENTASMSPASFTPEQDLHLVLCDFGRSGGAYVETDPSQADASTIVRLRMTNQDVIDLYYPVQIGATVIVQ
jgi:hypothetical protein